MQKWFYNSSYIITVFKILGRYACLNIENDINVLISQFSKIPLYMNLVFQFLFY